MKDKLEKDLHEAFEGEAKAYFRLRAFARKADEEGYPAVARLFRAVAESEAIHAANHFAVLGRVGDTQENVKTSFEKETFANEVAYPQFLKDAWAEENQEAIWALTKARNVEERHARLYRLVLSEMTMDHLPAYFVCRRCGWLEDGGAPEHCPNCEAPRQEYKKVD
jgi:rubrerythrin